MVRMTKDPAALNASAAKRTWYERHILPYLIELACSTKDVCKQREKVVPLARGRVLEIGIGTGLNLMHYDRAKIQEIVGLDPALEMHRLAKKRMQRSGLKVSLVGLSAERIPFDDAAFDTVLMTYTLCSIPDPISALKEMRRMLKPGGKLIFCEHGASPEPSVRRWQDRLNPLWSKMGGGCQLNRDVPRLLKDAGLLSSDMETAYLPGPRPLTYNFWGTAIAA